MWSQRSVRPPPASSATYRCVDEAGPDFVPSCRRAIQRSPRYCGLFVSSMPFAIDASASCLSQQRSVRAPQSSSSLTQTGAGTLLLSSPCYPLIVPYVLALTRTRARSLVASVVFCDAIDVHDGHCPQYILRLRIIAQYIW